MKKLKIFLVLGASATTNVKNSKTWIRNLYEPLVEMGHDVFLFDIDQFAKENGVHQNRIKAKEILSNKLVQIFLKHNDEKKFDLFFSYLWDSLIEPTVLLEIKKHIFTVNFTTNYHQFSLYKDIAKNVDINIYITKIAKQGFDSLGVKSYYMPLAANPKYYKQIEINKKYDVSFVGSAYGNRPYYLWRMLQHNIPVSIFGNVWAESGLKSILKNYRDYLKYFSSSRTSRLDITDSILRRGILNQIAYNFNDALNPSPNDDEYIKIISESKININSSESRFNHMFSNPNVLYGMNLRDFEITVSGGFLCTHYSDELPEFFELDKEVISFKNEIELISKVKFYLKNEKLLDKIRLSGFKRANEEHTWNQRLQKFFEFILNGI